VSKTVRRHAWSEAGEDVVLAGETERGVNVLTVRRAVARQTPRTRAVLGVSANPTNVM